MNLDIKFDNAELAEEFAQMLRDENMGGLRVKHEHQTAEKGSLASPELMEVLTLAVNPATWAGASAFILGAYKLFSDRKIKEKEEKTKEAERKLELEIKREDIAAKERVEMAKIAFEREKLALENYRIQQENETKRLELEVKEETERIRMLRDKK
jgi:hypothetical protein